MKKILYHGSNVIVDRPEYGKGSRTNDYGRGFYCTEEIELAREWACSKQRNGYVNQYEFHLSGLRILNLCSKEYNILNWLALLAEHRTYWQNGSISETAKNYLKENFLPDISEFDVIIGYRADDSYFSFAQDFVSGAISLQALSRAMHLGNLGLQVVLKSEKAFEQICFISSEKVDANIYHPQKQNREKQARSEYRKIKNEAGIDQLYMLDIMREGIQNGDARLS